MIKTTIKLQPQLKQKLGLFILTGSLAIGLIVTITFFYVGLPKDSVAGSSYQYPSMSFNNPLLISGLAGQVNAVYKFSNVSTGIDAHVKIMSFYNGASVSIMDNFTSGYYDAWQPFINSPGNKTSWIDWKVTFKIAGTNTDTILTQLAATAIDVDGDGASLKEIVGAHPVKTYSAMAGAQVVVTFRNDSCIATSSYSNVANIDTTKTQAMFMKIFNNVSSIYYRTGAVSVSGSVQIRQNSIYFKYFDMMPSPLPIELLSFKASVVNASNVELKWSTSSEKNNDFFTIERSADGHEFNEVAIINGAGNSVSTLNYSWTDISPLNGTSYYKLRQTDFDGTNEAFRPIAIDLSGTKVRTISEISPNPFQESFVLKFESENATRALVSMISIEGKIMAKEYLDVQQGINAYTFSNNEMLLSGTYICRINTGDEILFTEKVVKY